MLYPFLYTFFKKEGLSFSQKNAKEYQGQKQKTLI